MAENQEVQRRIREEIIPAFEEWYLLRNIQNQDHSFHTFLASHAPYQGIFAEGGTIEDLVYRSLSAEQQQRIGALFLPLPDHQDNGLPKRISMNGMVEDVRNVIPYTTPKQSNIIVGRLAMLLYSQLDESERRYISPERIKRHIMNLGFIQYTLSSRREICGIIIKYQPLFADAPEVLDSLVERYVDEEMAKTPVGETAKRVAELAAEVKQLYGE